MIFFTSVFVEVSIAIHVDHAVLNQRTSMPGAAMQTLSFRMHSLCLGCSG